MKKNSYFRVGLLRACPFCHKVPLVEPRMMGRAYEILCVNPRCKVKPTTGIHKDLGKALEIWRGHA